MYVDRAVREVCLVFAAVTLVAVALVRAGLAFGWPSLAPLGVALLFLFSALGMADRHGGAERFGIALGGLLAARDEGAPRPTREAVVATLRSAAREVAVAVAACTLAFPPFALAYVHWFELEGTFAPSVPSGLASLVATQILLVALPEEAFFRGYVQTRLGDAWPPTRGVLGAPVSARALLAQSTLFAVLHFVVEPLPDRLAVFFPALAFGWLRARRGGIGAALLFHAACNVYSDLLWRSMS